MFSILIHGALNSVKNVFLKKNLCKLSSIYNPSKRNLSNFPKVLSVNNFNNASVPNGLKSLTSYTQNTQIQPVRSITKFSLRKGKRKTCHAVLKRFYRLNWGMWIRGRCGRNKKLYKKSANHKRRLRQHVMTNATQSWLLDKMVTRFWRKPKYYIDDPYEPYHCREEFSLTRRKPWTPPDV